ncbi:DUF1641 domain-containing protein [Parageobacillus thermoglucosidasius]|uniref:DUF1641 domain-containing protein n=1 Tax=Parageobacillus thermoglucosidasius TaxID=1426 RepID=UPI0001D17313|nr:DUF1641 domain-containing protein [Parageobacillus thermoglucosidasius]KYD17022.1 hypothetical protein B4168_1422 [Anoxybacillus flavithermus]REK54201.1 MAG: DUF1641 domain-containing protein [Geobacillus sp.]AEH48044.1 protein of unknown function DUF1641 [Parageobacillus thermoglucosidasius C56-YS93]EID44108.1 hypothetical protein GT20_1829 [Parageobacillus thermoglucosidasius TNO-09.020]MBY6266905.1 DUF1641 domain-containing protein [Parageobacillus thermoglucosidasius]
MGEARKGAVMEAAIDHLLVEKLSDPRTMEQLIRLLDRLENVTFLLDMLENFLRRGPEFADSINELIILLRQSLSRPEYVTRFEHALTALQRMQEFLDSPQVQELFKSDVLDVRSAQIIGKMLRSLHEASKEAAETETKRVGIIGLMRALSDPEMQPTLNFFLHFVRHLSKELNDA